MRTAEALGLGEAFRDGGRPQQDDDRGPVDVLEQDRLRTTLDAADALERGRNAVSCAMTSSAQAIRVVASGPIAAIVPFVVYGPSYVLHPAEPPTFARRKTAVRSVPSIGAMRAPGADA